MSALARKLQVKTGTILLVNAPGHYRLLLQPLPADACFADRADKKPGHIHLFVKDSTELQALFPQVAGMLDPGTVFWVMYPKRSSGIATDLAMVSNWPVLSEHGLRPVSSAAVDDTWTALRFKREADVKRSAAGNAEISAGEMSLCINPVNRTVRLPDDVLEKLKPFPEALAWFNQLAFTHKKEYAVWILGAKQEKTRAARIEKMVDMLKAQRKNPSAR